MLSAPGFATFEVVPVAGIEDRVERVLPAGARVAVPHLPSHGLRRSGDVAVALAGRGFSPVPHVAARAVRSPRELDDHLDRLWHAGVRELLLVGGDAPTAVGPYPDASSLLMDVVARSRRFDRVGVAGHPEARDDPANRPDALQVLAAKERLGATYIVTQMCFDPGALGAWIARLREAGVTLPVVLGVAGPIPVAKLLRLGLRLGVGPSLRTLRSNRGARRMLLAGRAYDPDSVVAPLLVARSRDATPLIVGVHLFTFNALEATMAWLDARIAAEAARGVHGRVVD